MKRLVLVPMLLLWLAAAAVADEAEPVRKVFKAQPLYGVSKTQPVRKVFKAQPLRVVVEHLAKPTIKAIVLSHNFRTTAHESRCAMCLGQHMRNFHGKTYDELDEVGYGKWVQYHEGLHDQGVYKAPDVCVGGSCSTSSGRSFRVLRRR